jgi:hypothetical protein
MDLIYDAGLKIILKDKNGGESELLINSYNTYSDGSIEITTVVKNTELERGWVGDMVCCTPAGMDLNGDIVEGTEICEMYHDVLLRSVKIDSAEFREAVTWKYIFLKD